MTHGPCAYAAVAWGDREGMGDEEALRRLVEDEWARAAAAERGRTRRLREQAAEEGTLAGTLLDAAESRVPVQVRTVGARLHQGTVLGIGEDFCALRMPDGRWLYVALHGITSVRVDGGARLGDAGTRSEVADRTLAEVLAHLAPERPRAILWLGSDRDPVIGELRSVGHDIATIGLDGPSRQVAHIRLAALTEAVVDC